MAARKVSSKTTTTESLLGLLSMGPMSGYEIRQLIEESIGNFWTESYGQIYPALKKMVAEGLAEVKEERAEGRPLKKVYTLTELGHGRLREWLAVPAGKQVPRNELLLKMFFGAEGELPVLREQVEARRAKLSADLKRYEAAVKSMSERHAGNPGLRFWRMTAKYGIAEAKALIGWCNECLEEMQ